MKSGILAEPTLVGREKELEELQRCLDLAIVGKGNTIFVSGEAGSGKTRLTREFLNAVRKRGMTVLSGWCLSDAAAPYFPFVEAFNSYFSRFEDEQPMGVEAPEAPPGLPRAGEAASVDRGITAWLAQPKIAERPGRLEALSPQAWKDQVFAGVAKTLHAISVQEPVVLFIEDVHWADSASLALLHYVARATQGSERILVLSTFRSEELTADSEGRPHPLAETLRLMRREDLYREIKLRSLDHAEVGVIAENMMGGSLQKEFAEKLAHESRGNPLFVVESLRMLSESKGLALENNEWRLAVDELGIPPKVRDIILQRLSALRYAQRRVLDAASVIGEKFEVELLSAVLGLNALEVLETLNVIAHSTSLIHVEEGNYGFNHARSREALYGELSAPLKRGYHEAVAERIVGSSKNGKLPFSEVAYHYVQAGSSEKAVKYSLAAAQDALARGSNTEAINNFTYVLQVVGEDPSRAEEKAIALEGLGDALFFNGMFKEAARIFMELLNATKADAVRLRTFRKAMESVHQYGDAPYLMELAKKAEPYAAADRLEYARVLVQRGRSFILQRMYSAALKDWEAALHVFEEEYSLWDVAGALGGVGSMHARSVMDSVAKEGLAGSLRSIALFEELGDYRQQMEVCKAAGWMLFGTLFLEDEALKMSERIVEIDARMKIGDFLQLSYANMNSAYCFTRLDDLDKVLVYALKALGLSKRTDSAALHGTIYSLLTITYARLGEAKRAEEYFEELMRLPPEILIHTNVDGELTKAVFLTVKSQWKEANQIFEKRREDFKPLTGLVPPGRVQFFKKLYAWSLEKQGRFEEAKTLIEENMQATREAKERFAHASVQASILARRRAEVGQEFEMRIDLVNAGRKPGSILRVEGVFPSDGFQVACLTSGCILHGDEVELKESNLAPFQVVTLKFSLRASRAGTYTVKSQVVYTDDLGETKAHVLKPLVITVEPAPQAVHVLPDRVSSGYDDLDDLLLGGIPENSAITLASPSCNEKEQLLKRFLEAGATAGETTFHIATEAANTKTLVEECPSSFYLFLCNPQADTMVQSAPNVFKLKGVENLTEIDIALAKAFRTLNPSATGPKRVCIDVVSDILLQHHAVTTRRWLSALLPTLKSKGFTILAVIDPAMHPAEETQAVLGLFDGEITILEKETPKGTEKFLKVKRMAGQKYLKDETALAEE